MTNRKPPATAYKPGQSGNPAGKPKGARHHATRMVLALMEGGAEEITQAVIDAAKGGDLAAARIVIDRLAPPMRERPIELPLPDTKTAEGVSNALQVIFEAVGKGDITTGEANALAAILEARRKAIETQELEARVTALETKK